MTISPNLAAAVAWFAEHETDRPGPADTPYEIMKRTFGLDFDEACAVCREVRRIVGPYPATGGGIAVQNSKRPQTARAVFRTVLHPRLVPRARGMEVNNGS